MTTSTMTRNGQASQETQESTASVDETTTTPAAPAETPDSESLDHSQSSPESTTAIAIPIGQIKVGPRHRKDLGDLNALAEDIHDIGLLCPILVTPDYQLIDGERRLRAVQ